MRAVFVSYQFGEASVFMDVADIAIGRDFRHAIEGSGGTCGVLLAMVGRNQVDTQNEP